MASQAPLQGPAAPEEDLGPGRATVNVMWMLVKKNTRKPSSWTSWIAIDVNVGETYSETYSEPIVNLVNLVNQETSIAIE